MKKLIIKIVIFLGIQSLVIVLPLVLADNIDRGMIDVQVWETETSYELVPQNEHMDLIILGPSRAREFARYEGQWKEFQDILGVDKVVNLAQGGGSGLTHAILRLNYFFRQGNSVDHIWYFIDPRMLNSKDSNEDNPFGEVLFDRLTLFDMVKLGYHFDTIQEYYRKIFYQYDNFKKFKRSQFHDVVIDDIDDNVTQTINDHYYPEGVDHDNFKKYRKKIIDIIELANQHDAEITFIIYPEFYDVAELGMPKLRSVLAELSRNYDMNFVDYRDVIKNTKYYYNHNYLNSAGTRLFAKKYLSKLLE